MGFKIWYLTSLFFDEIHCLGSKSFFNCFLLGFSPKFSNRASSPWEITLRIRFLLRFFLLFFFLHLWNILRSFPAIFLFLPWRDDVNILNDVDMFDRKLPISSAWFLPSSTLLRFFLFLVLLVQGSPGSGCSFSTSSSSLCAASWSGSLRRPWRINWSFLIREEISPGFLFSELTGMNSPANWLKFHDAIRKVWLPVKLQLKREKRRTKLVIMAWHQKIYWRQCRLQWSLTQISPSDGHDII